MARQRTIVTHGLVWLGTALLACLGGCSSASKPAGPPLKSNPAVIITMHWHSFDPKTVTIQQGQTIQWHNGTWVSHTVTCDPDKAQKAEDIALPKGAVPFDSGSVGSGDDYQYTFTVPGDYHYICIPHETMGMLGEVIVQPAPTP